MATVGGATVASRAGASAHFARPLRRRGCVSRCARPRRRCPADVRVILRDAALHEDITAGCAPDVGLRVKRGIDPDPAGLAARSAAIAAATRTIPGPSSPSLTLFVGEVDIVAGARTDRVQLLSRTDAVHHIEVLSSVPQPGVWLSRSTAAALAVGPGDSIAVRADERDAALPVQGVFTDLLDRRDASWCALESEIVGSLLAAAPPVALVDADALLGVAHALGGDGVGRLVGGGAGLVRVDPARGPPRRARVAARVRRGQQPVVPARRAARDRDHVRGPPGQPGPGRGGLRHRGGDRGTRRARGSRPGAGGPGRRRTNVDRAAASGAGGPAAQGRRPGAARRQGRVGADAGDRARRPPRLRCRVRLGAVVRPIAPRRRPLRA